MSNLRPLKKNECKPTSNPCILKKGIRSDVGDMIGEEGGPTGPKAKDRLYKNFDQENSENQEHQDRF